jgi:hypothetical protein
MVIVVEMELLLCYIYVGLYKCSQPILVDSDDDLQLYRILVSR